MGTHSGSAVTCLRLPVYVVATLAALVALPASIALADEGTENNNANPDTTADVKRIFRTRCLECHNATRREADIDILDHATLVGEGKAVVPGDVDASPLYDLIASDDEDYRMPEAPRPPLNQGEIEKVRRWIANGAPDFPDDVPGSKPKSRTEGARQAGNRYVLKQILSYVQKLPRSDRAYVRFFSSNHLLESGVTAAELETNRQALAKAINHLSWQPDIVRPVNVDKDTNSIFAVDIRKLGWYDRIFKATDASASHISKDLDLFDLVLLEYPYSYVLEDDPEFAELYERYIEPAKLVRPIPYVRIDWFVSVATQAPLYEDLLQLPHELAELERELGVNSSQNIKDYNARRAGMTLSGVSRNNRVVERHPARYGAYWKSFDFQTSKGQQNMFADPIEFHFAGGEMIWNLPNGLQGYLVTDNIGRRILTAPTAIVTDKFSEDRIVRNGLACMRCHNNGMKRFADNVRPAFETLTTSVSLNRQTILRLYAPKKEMDELLDRDQNRFLTALEDALGTKQQDEPLVPTSRKFLDAPLTLLQAASEVGLVNSDGLQSMFRLPEFTRLGLGGLSTGGLIRRDTWEDYFDRVVRRLGAGNSVPPIDGLTRPDQLAGTELATQVNLSTNKSGNVFSPGDELVIFLENKSGHELFVEMTGTSARGRIADLTDGVVSLAAGKKLRIPESGSLTIQPRLGVEFITAFVHREKFPGGITVRAEKAADRFIHPFFQYSPETQTVSETPIGMVKKTIQIETR